MYLNILTNCKKKPDEPTGNLDMTSALNIMDCFTRINQENHKAVVMVTHDPLTASYCNKILFLVDGVIRIICENSGNQNEFYEQIVRTVSNMRG